MTLPIGLLILVGVGYLIWSLTFVGVFFLIVPLGILLFWIFIVSLLPSLVLRSMMMVVLGLLCILLFGPAVVRLRSVRFVFLLGSLLGSLVLLVFGGMDPMLVFGRTLLGFWLSFALFLSSLHWPSTVDDLGVGGGSFVELLFLCERWAGERLVLEMSVPKSRRLHRSISVSAVPDGPSIDIWRSCRFLGAIIRALADLPGGLGRFLDGSLRMRYCSVYFSRKKPTWRLPHPGGVATLVDAAFLHPVVDGLLGPGDAPSFSYFGDGKRKRIRLTKKTNVRKP